MKNKTTRNPNGLVKDKPIALRLMQDELSDAEKLSKDRHQSKSAMARDAYLLGLPLLKQQSPQKSA